MNIKIKYQLFLLISLLFSLNSYSLELISPLRNPTSTTDNHSDNEFDRLLQASLFTPSMQQSILALHQQPFIFNKKTNRAENVPSIQESLNLIEISCTASSFFVSKEIVLAAVNDIVEALEIAYTLLQIQSAYQTFDQKINQSYITEIKNYQTQAKNCLTKINGAHLSFRSTPVQKIDAFNLVGLDYKILVGQELTDFITSHDFTKITDASQSAFTLFLQCYKALHHYQKKSFDSVLHEISLENLCKKITNNGNTPQTHQNLIIVRQALQLALFIANKNSKINAFNAMPTSIVSILDKTVSQLKIQEAIVAQLCKDKNLGATDVYIQNQDQYDKLTAIAYTTGNALLIAGLTTAGLFGAIYYIGLPSLYQALPGIIQKSLDQSVPGLLERNVPWFLDTTKNWSSNIIDTKIDEKIDKIGHFLAKGLNHNPDIHLFFGP
jgi:hypothetical protein